jgi:DNA-binding beta-propeller fold protein YncE
MKPLPFRRRILPLALAGAAAFVLPLVSLASEEGVVLVHEDFQNNYSGEPLHNAVTSDQLWTWHRHTGEPIVSENEGNLFANFNASDILSLTLRSRETQGWLTLDTNKPFEIAFDYLYMTGWGDNQWLSLDYLLADRYTNMAATATTDPVGYRLAIRVTSATQLEYRIRYKANGTWASVPGTEGTVQSSGLLGQGETIPGNPTRVVLRVHGNQQTLTINGQEVVNGLLQAPPQNLSYPTNSYIQFWSGNSRRRGFDNFTVRQFEAPPIQIAPAELYWANATIIRGAEKEGSGVRTAAVELNRPNGIAIDAAGGHVFWSENAGGRIMRMGLDGSDPTLLTTVSAGQQLAINPSLGKLYWGSWQAGWYSSDLDGNNLREIYPLWQLYQSSGAATVAVDTVTGHVYLGSATEGGALLRVQHDGSNPQYLTTLGSGVYGTVFDSTSNRLYFTNFDQGTLSFLNPVTLAVTTLATGLGQPLGIAITPDGSRLYWTERTGGLIRTATVSGDTLGTIATLVSGEDSPFGIAVIEREEPPPVTFASWIAGFGLSTQESEAGADPDGDGIPNLLEYFLGGTPTAANRSLLPVQAIETVAGVPYLTLSFPRNPDAAGVSFAIEQSVDLQNWLAAGSSVMVLEEAPDQMKIGLPLSEANDARHFLRLRVSAD